MNKRAMFLANILVYTLKQISDQKLYKFSDGFKAELLDFCEKQHGLESENERKENY